MINLRYHIVSLVAVFLALAVGIVMGSTVIDRAIVDGLQNRVNSVDNRARRTDEENRRLAGQLDLMRNFADQARDQLVEGQLRGVPVLVVTVQGVDTRPVEDLREALATAEAVSAGTLLLTAKFRLENEGDVRALATVVNLAGGAAEGVRRQAISRLVGVLDGTANDATFLPALVSAGFVGYEPPTSSLTTTTGMGLSSFPVTGLRMVLVSGAGAEVGDDRLALPLAQGLAQSPATTPRLVAAESGQDTPGGRALFVGRLRSEASLPRLSTVDNLESPIGQAAVVLALADLGVPRAGNYGVAPGAERLLPSVEP